MDFDYTELTNEDLYVELDELEHEWWFWLEEDVVLRRIRDILMVLRDRGVDPTAPEYIERWIKSYL